MPADLSGLLVVSLEQAVAAPLASRLLADAGARVIKLERHDGDFARGYDDSVGGLASYFVWLNAGKESLTVDIKDDGDRAMVERIVARADVFIQNLAPGAAERAGLAGAALSARHPRLIACDISGYGEDGPYRDMKAYDFLVQAETGLASITGTPGHPSRVGISICDIGCGTQAALAIQQALFARERTGEGRTIAISLFGAIAEWMNVPYLQHRYGGREIGPVGLRHPSIAPYGAFTCGDGVVVVISIQNEREWQRFCTVFLGDAEIASDRRFADNVSRVGNREACDAMIQARFADLDRQQAAELLSRAGTAFGMLNSLDDLGQHPQARFTPVETEAGVFDLLASAPAVDGDQVARRRVPQLGEHSAAIRREFAE